MKRGTRVEWEKDPSSRAEWDVPADINDSRSYIPRARAGLYSLVDIDLSAGTSLSGQIRKHWDEIYPLLLAILGSPKKAEMAKTALALQVFCSYSFASAKYLSGSAFSSEKTWDRTLKALQEKGLVKVFPLFKIDGRRSTNLLDFYPLMKLLLKLFERSIGMVRRIGKIFWIKISGVWAKREDLLEFPCEGG